MIEKAYIDTNILAAYYCPEMLSDKADKLLASVKQPVISVLTEIELMSVISKKCRKKEMTKKDGKRIIENYIAHLREGYYRKVFLKSEHYLYARDKLGSLQYSLHSLDALHLAMVVSECILFITGDKNLFKVAQKNSVESQLVN